MTQKDLTARKDGQHTPGPWEADEYYITAGKDRSGAPITIACAPSGAFGNEFSEANARLIAAAPDLEEWGEDALSCLKEYRQYAEGMRAIGRGFHPVGMKGHSIDAVICGLEAAIRKAKGE